MGKETIFLITTSFAELLIITLETIFRELRLFFNLQNVFPQLHKNQVLSMSAFRITYLLFPPFTGFVSEKVQLLLDTMTEITRILYAKVQERCQRSVLRLHNKTFSMLLHVRR